MKVRVFISLSMVIIFVTGCTTIRTGLLGAAAGTAVGAGTGGLIGALIPNGDRTSSAIVGAVIGGVTGTAGGLTYEQLRIKNQIEENDILIKANEMEIRTTDSEIAARWNELREDSPEIYPSEDLKEHLYTGPTLGSPTR